jgi:signal transduction histidine kinase
VVALQGLVSQFAVHAPFTLEFHQEGNLSDWPLALSVSLYRILQEALTNIQRHAGATEARIQLEEEDQHVALTVSDNGCYTENTPLRAGYGLKGIQERSQALGGDLCIPQYDLHGLKLRVVIPILPSLQTYPSLTLPERRQTHE